MARMRTSLIAATATIAALGAPTTASAAPVNCTQLHDALATSSPGAFIEIAEDAQCSEHYTLPSHTITLNGDVDGDGDRATLTGFSKGNFQIMSGHDVASTTIRGIDFVGGETGDDGGAIDITGDSPVTIRDNSFTANFAEGDGGAVSIDAQESPPVEVLTRGDATPIVLSNNLFGGADFNEAEGEGGAVYIRDLNRPVVVDEENQFLNNVSDGDGGGLYIAGAREVVLLDNSFEGNKSAEDGGGAEINICSTAEITGNRFIGNSISDEEDGLEGGGLALRRDGCFDDRAAARGLLGPQVVQARNLFQGNTISGSDTTGYGGGEYIDDLTVLSTNDSFVGNRIDGTSEGYGGGLASVGAAGVPFTARNLVAAGNTITPEPRSEQPSRGAQPLEGLGGGLLLASSNSDSEFRVEDSTIEGNTAPQGSGIAGFLQFNGGEARSAIFGDKLVLENSIVFGNTGASDTAGITLDGEIAGFFEREVQFSDACVDGEPHTDLDDSDGTSNVCVDPQTAGASTDGNVDQVSTSPTRDAGKAEGFVDDDLTQDYKGDARIIDGKVDMGADEFKPAPVVTPDPDPEPDPDPTPTTQTPPAAAPPAGAVQGVQRRSCTSRRVFRIRIRTYGKKALSATVRVNGKKVKIVRGKRLRAPVRLRGLPKGRFTVRITVRLANGKKLTGVRRYRTCIPKQPGDGPPRV